MKDHLLPLADNNGLAMLECPNCYGTNGVDPCTHMDFVDVTTHMGTLRTYANGEGSKVGAYTELLPETERGRRHTITIHWTCEFCSFGWAVSFQQHKGSTMVRQHKWNIPPWDDEAAKRRGADRAPVFLRGPWEQR